MEKFLKIFLFGVLTLTLFIFVVNVVVYVSSSSFIYSDINEVPEAPVVLVLGAAVSRDGILSPIFTDRLDKAIALYKADKVATILVSGDNSTRKYNEVNAAYLYLIDKGIPEADIYLDHAGFDTYSSMYRARDIFSVSKIIVSTQAFHLPRSIFIARRLGLEAYGINADSGQYFFRNSVREVFANQKAVFELLFHIKPKYLGEEIPIL